MRRWLEARGHSVTGGTNPDVALRELGKNTFDLVLLDILMPKANGLSMISEILRMYPKMPIVVISALLDPHLAAVATQQGSTTCLAKPINWADLERIVQSVQHQKIHAALGA